MKAQIYFLFIICGIWVNSKAQETNSPDSTLGWKFPSIINLTFSQVSFTDWAAGGENSLSLNGLLSVNANYKSSKSIWENNLILAYGIMKQGDKELRKTDDIMEFSSKYGYKATQNWYYSALLQFKSQFAEGYKYDDIAGTKTLLSTFMSPGYLNLSAGMNYAPSKKFSVFIGAVSGRNTFVLDDSLSQNGAFGVEPGENNRMEFGGTIKVMLNTDLVKNVNLSSKLELFSNYMENPQNIDIDWLLLISMKVNEWLSANINLQMIYDDDIGTIDENNISRGAKIQFKEVFGAGLSLKF